MSLSLKEIIKKQAEKIDQLEVRIRELEAENHALHSENAKFKEKLGLNSKNSSIPSSKELYRRKKSERKVSERKRGGQVGHKGYFRAKMEADEIINVRLENVLCDCGGEFCIDSSPHIHQTVDIPKIKPHVTNYQLNRYRCNKCGISKKAQLPYGVSNDTFGNNISAIISSLTAFYKNSKRDVQSILRDIFNLDISLGSVSNREGKVSNKCKDAYEDIELQVNDSDVVHIDETGHSYGGRKGWCWIFASEVASLIKLEDSRGQKVLKHSVFGPRDSVYVTDRYPSYNYLDDEMRQICWAHLRRDFARVSSSNHSKVMKFGIYLEQLALELFALRDALSASNIDILYFKRRIQKLRRRCWRYLQKITLIPNAESAVKKAETIIKSEDMMWRFLYDPYNIPLTNNHAEQQIRHYVIYRKISFFTQSDRGNRFLERLMSLFLTWRKRGKNPFSELSQLIAA